MSSKPIFVATHPRACSTAFERVFMTYRNTLSCVHEPFGDAWYFGPERLSNRFDNEEERKKSGFSETTYRDILNTVNQEAKVGKRLFIKDMAQYWIPLPSQTSRTKIAPSLVDYRRGVGTGRCSPTSDSSDSTSFNEDVAVTEPGNPTVIPDSLLHQFHFTFLIRHPRSSVPSYYRCTVPPLNKMTGFDYFDPAEAGYRELRMLFEYLVSAGHIGPTIAGSGERTHALDGVTGNGTVDICVVDADDMLDNPSGVIEAYCKSVGIDYDPGSLKWDDEECQQNAKEIFDKWKGFHEDALDSKELRPRTRRKAIPTDDELMNSWAKKYGENAAQTMILTVKENEADYEYLKQFALKV